MNRTQNTTRTPWYHRLTALLLAFVMTFSLTSGWLTLPVRAVEGLTLEIIELSMENGTWKVKVSGGEAGTDFGGWAFAILPNVIPAANISNAMTAEQLIALKQISAKNSQTKDNMTKGVALTKLPSGLICVQDKGSNGEKKFRDDGTVELSGTFEIKELENIRNAFANSDATKDGYYADGTQVKSNDIFNIPFLAVLVTAGGVPALAKTTDEMKAPARAELTGGNIETTMTTAPTVGVPFIATTTLTISGADAEIDLTSTGGKGAKLLSLKKLDGTDQTSAMGASAEILDIGDGTIEKGGEKTLQLKLTAGNVTNGPWIGEIEIPYSTASIAGTDQKKIIQVTINVDQSYLVVTPITITMKKGDLSSQKQSGGTVTANFSTQKNENKMRLFMQQFGDGDIPANMKVTAPTNVPNITWDGEDYFPGYDENGEETDVGIYEITEDNVSAKYQFGLELEGDWGNKEIGTYNDNARFPYYLVRNLKDMNGSDLSVLVPVTVIIEGVTDPKLEVSEQGKDTFANSATYTWTAPTNSATDSATFDLKENAGVKGQIVDYAWVVGASAGFKFGIGAVMSNPFEANGTGTITIKPPTVADSSGNAFAILRIFYTSLEADATRKSVDINVKVEIPEPTDFAGTLTTYLNENKSFDPFSGSGDEVRLMASDNTTTVSVARDTNAGTWKFENAQLSETYTVQVKPKESSDWVTTNVIVDKDHKTDASVRFVTVEMGDANPKGNGEGYFYPGNNYADFQKNKDAVIVLTSVETPDSVYIGAIPKVNRSFTGWSDGSAAGTFGATNSAQTTYQVASSYASKVILTPSFDKNKFSMAITITLDSQNATDGTKVRIEKTADSTKYVEAVTDDGVAHFDELDNGEWKVTNVGTYTMAKTETKFTEIDGDEGVEIIFYTLSVDPSDASVASAEISVDGTTFGTDPVIVQSGGSVYVKATAQTGYTGDASWTTKQPESGNKDGSACAAPAATTSGTASTAITVTGTTVFTPKFTNYDIELETLLDGTASVDNAKIVSVSLWNEANTEYVDLTCDTTNTKWTATTDKTGPFTKATITTDTGEYQYVKLKDGKTISTKNKSAQVDLWTVTANTQTNWVSGTTLPSGVTAPTHKVALGTKAAEDDTTTGVVPDGMSVTLTATADTKGYRFDTTNGWKFNTSTQDIKTVSGASTNKVTAKDTTFTANFEPIPVTASDATVTLTYGEKKTTNAEYFSAAVTGLAQGDFTYTANLTNAGLPNWLKVTGVVKDGKGNGIQIVTSDTTARPNTVGTYTVPVTITAPNGTSASVTYTIKVEKATSTVEIKAKSGSHYVDDTIDSAVDYTVKGSYYMGDPASTYSNDNWKDLEIATATSTTSSPAPTVATDSNGSTTKLVANSSDTSKANVKITASKPTGGTAELAAVWTKTEASTDVPLTGSYEVTVNVYKDGTADNNGFDKATISGTAITGGSKDGTLASGTTTINGIPSGNSYTVTLYNGTTAGDNQAVNVSSDTTVEFKYWTISVSVDTACTSMGSASYDTDSTITADGTYYNNTGYKITATPDSGYHFVRWDITTGDATSTGNSASVNGNLTAKMTYKAVFAPNTVTIKTNLNGAADTTTNRTITLYDSTGASATSFAATTSTSGQVQFTAVPNGTYQIWDATAWTGLTVMVDNGDPEQTIQYYTVKFDTAVTNGSYASGADTTDKEVISKGDATAGRNTVDLPKVERANDNFDFEKWADAPAAGSNDASSKVNSTDQSVDGAKWTITNSYNGKGGITLTASYKKARYSVTVHVTLNGTNVSGKTITYTPDGGSATTTSDSIDSNGKLTITGLTDSTKYTFAVNDTSYNGTYDWTIASADKEDLDMKYVSYYFDENKPKGVTTNVTDMPTPTDAATAAIVKSGETISGISSPKLDGYQFKGWGTTSTDTSGWTGSTTVADKTDGTPYHYFATWSANVVKITVNLDNAENDTKANTVYLVDSSNNPITDGRTVSGGVVTYTGLPYNSGNAYKIVTDQTNKYDTNHTVTVIEEGGEATATLNYYTVTYIDVNDNTDHGHYDTTPVTNGEVLLGGIGKVTNSGNTYTANLNYVTLPDTTAVNSSYAAVVWKETDSAGTDTTAHGVFDPADNNATNNATKWAISFATSGEGTGIYLKPTFPRTGYTITVMVTLDGNAATQKTVTATEGSNKLTASEDTSNAGTYIISGATADKTYTIEVADGSTKWNGTTTVTTGNGEDDPDAVEMNFFTVAATEGTGAKTGSALVSATNGDFSGNTDELVFLANTTAYLKSEPDAANGYGGNGKWEGKDGKNNDVTISGNGTGTSFKVTTTTTATASYDPNVVEIKVYKDNVLDATKTVSLEKSDDTIKTYNATSSGGTTTFSPVVQGTYKILVSGTDTGLTVEIKDSKLGDTTTREIFYYTVRVSMPVNASKTEITDGGTMSATIQKGSEAAQSASAGNFASVELLAGGSDNYATVTTNVASTSYGFTSWTVTPSGAPSVSDSGTGNSRNGTFTLSTDSKIENVDSTNLITLYPTYNKGGVDLKVKVNLNSSAASGKNVLVSGTDKGATNSSGELTINNLATSTEYTFTVKDGTTAWEGEKKYTISGDNETLTLNYVTYKFETTTKPANATGSITVGSGVANGTVMTDTTMNWKDGLTLPGYTFKGWKDQYNTEWTVNGTYTVPDKSGTSDGDKEITFTPIWEPNPIELSAGIKNGTYGQPLGADDSTKLNVMSATDMDTAVKFTKKADDSDTYTYEILQSGDENTGTWGLSAVSKDGVILSVKADGGWELSGTPTPNPIANIVFTVRVTSALTKQTATTTVTVNLGTAKVSAVDVTAIPVPEIGKSPSGTTTGSMDYGKATIPADKGYKDNGSANAGEVTVTWTDSEGNTVTKFEYGKSYVATVTVKTDNGYEFANSVSTSANKLGGTDSDKQSADKTPEGTAPNQTVTVTYTFPAVYLLKYDANGGTFPTGTSNPADVEIKQGDTITIAADPNYTKGSKGNIGWSFESGDNKTKKYDFNQNNVKIDEAFLANDTQNNDKENAENNGIIYLYYVWQDGSLKVTAQDDLAAVYNMSQSEWTTGTVTYQGRKYDNIKAPTEIVLSSDGGIDYTKMTYALEQATGSSFNPKDYLEIVDYSTGTGSKKIVQLKSDKNIPDVGNYEFVVKVTNSETHKDASATFKLNVRPIELDHAALSDLQYNGESNTTLDVTVTKQDTQTADWKTFYKDIATNHPDGTQSQHNATDTAINVDWSGVSAYATATAGGVYTATITLKPADSNYVFVEYTPNGTLSASDKADGWYVGEQKATTGVTGANWKYELKDETGSGTAKYNTVVLTKTFNPADISVTATLTATAHDKLKVSNFVAATVSNVKLYYLIYKTDMSSTFNDGSGNLSAKNIKSAYDTIAGGTTDSNCIANGVSDVIAPTSNAARMADFDVTTNVNSDTTYYLYVFAEVVKSDGTSADPAKLAANKDTATTPKKLTLTHNGYGSVSWTMDANIADTPNAKVNNKTLLAGTPLTSGWSKDTADQSAVISMFQDDTFTATPADTDKFGFAKWTLKKGETTTDTDNSKGTYSYVTTGDNADVNDEILHAIFYRKINGSFTILDPTATTAKTYTPSYANTVNIGAVAQDGTTNKLPDDSANDWDSKGGIKYQWYYCNNAEQDEKVDTGWTAISDATSLNWQNTANAYPGATFRLKITYKDPDNGGEESFVAAKTGVQVTPLPAPTPVLSKVESTVDYANSNEAHFYLSDTDKTNGTNEIDKDEGGLHLTFPKITQESENAVEKYKITLYYNDSDKNSGALTVADTVEIAANGSNHYYYWWEAGLSGDNKVVPGYNYQVKIEAIAKAGNGKYSDTATPTTDDDPAGYKTWRPSALVDKTFNGASQDGHSGWNLPTVGFGTLTVKYENVRSDSTTAETNKTHVNITTVTGNQTETKPEYDVYISLTQLEKGEALYLGIEQFNFTTTQIQPNTYLTVDSKKVANDNRDWKITQATPTLTMTTTDKAVRESQTLAPKMTYTTGASDCWNNGTDETKGDITRYYDYDFSFKLNGTTATADTDYTFDQSTGTFIGLKPGTFTVTVKADYKSSTTDQFKADIATATKDFTITIGDSAISSIKLERFEAVNGAKGNTDDESTTKDVNRPVTYATSTGSAYDSIRGYYDSTTAAKSKEMLLKGLRLTVTYTTGATDVYVFGDSTYQSNMARSANTWDGKTLPTGFEWVVSGTDAAIDNNTAGTKLTFNKAGNVDISVKYGGLTTKTVTYKLTPKTLTATVTGGDKIWDGSSDARNIKGEDGTTTTNGTKIELNANQTYATAADTVPVKDDVTVTATGFDYYNGSNKVSDVGNNYTVQATGAKLTGTQAGFYKLGTVTNGTGNITPRAITEIKITTPELFAGMTPADANKSAELTVTAKDSIGKTNVLVDYSSEYKNNNHIKWQVWTGTAWVDIDNNTKFSLGSQYRPVIEVKADTNHYLVENRTPDNYTIDGKSNGEEVNDTGMNVVVTIQDNKSTLGANNTGVFESVRNVGAVRPVLKFKDNYNGNTRAYEVDYRQIITVTVGDSLADYDFNVFLQDTVANAKNVKVTYDTVTSGAIDLKDRVTLTPTITDNIGDMNVDDVNNSGKGYSLILPDNITATAGEYELSLSANGSSEDGLSQINTAHYHLIIVVQEPTGDGDGGAEPMLKFSDSYNNDTTIDPNYQQSYTRVISLVEGDTISDTEYLVSLKDFTVNAKDVTLKLVENTAGATVTDKTNGSALTSAGMNIGDLNANATRELTLNLPATLGKGSYLLHITADGKNDAGNAGSTAHYYLVITVAEKKTTQVTVPGGTTTITTTVEVPVVTPVVTYWISEKGVTNDLTAEKMEKVGDHPSFTPKVSGLDGYTFIGWSETDPATLKSGETVTLVDPLTFEITEDKTFYACYERSGNDHKNYVIGYPDGTFRPDAPITRAEVATIVARSCLDGFVEGYDYGNPGNYTDVNLKGWYASAVAYCTMMGVFTGYKDGTFRPAQYITREELATVVARLAGIRTNNGIPFADAADVSKWARDGVYTCYAYGYINGYSDGTFRPQNDITRAETVKIFNGYLNRGVDATGLSGLTPFVLSGTASRGELDNGHQYLTWEDVPAKHWAYYEIIEASNTHDYHWPTKVENPPEDWDAAYIQEEWLARAHYIITWMAGEGTASAATTRAKLNATPVAPQILQAPEGMVLLGWATEPNGAIVDLTTYTVTGATTFYAVYGAKPDPYYTVRYVTNEKGTLNGADSEQVKEGNTPVAMPTVTPTEDYVFIGWANREGYMVDVTSYVVTADMTFYAVYTEELKFYNVFYITNAYGTLNGSASEQVQAGQTALAAPTVTPVDGYSFKGWALSENGDVVDNTAYIITADTTFHAVYAEKESYTVSYVSNAYGTLSGATSELVKSGMKPVATPKATAMDGHSFKGWALSENGTVVNVATYAVTENTTFYAVYAKKTQTTYTHTAFADGYADGSFHASEEITRAAVADMLARIHSDYDPNHAYNISAFKDLTSDYWAANAIGYCVEKGIFTGTTATTFEPERTMTRQEFSVVIARMAGIQTNEGLPFTDASNVSKWARDAVYTVYVNGWITGYKDGTFLPKKTITRAEAVKIICGFLGRNVTRDSIGENLTVTSWSDVARKNWAYPYIMEATNTHTYYIDDSGKEIWVSGTSSGTTLEVPTQNTPAGNEVLYTGYVNAASGLNARTAPEIGNNVVQVLAGNTQVEVLELINDWCKIRFRNTSGATAEAYVKTQYITRDL